MNTSDSGHGGDLRRVQSQYGVENILDFSSNINPLGLPKGFSKALSSAYNEIIHYPEISHLPISNTLARHLGVKPDKVLLGNGSTELLYLVPLALKPKRCLIFAPAYADYERSFRRAGVTVDFLTARESDDFHWDLSKPRIAGYDIIVMGNPNNPSSVYTPKEKILDLARSHPKTTFLVDEAFIDFLPRQASLIGAGMPPNILVLKSLTKFYAIPGLRLGCLVSSADVIKRVNEVQEPWTVNCLAAAAGEFLLKETGHASTSRAFILKEKEYLFGQLSKIPHLYPFQPAANFILVKITLKGLSSTSLKETLACKGILIRDCSNFKGLSEKYFRVSVNSHKENKLLLASLKESIIGNH